MSFVKFIFDLDDLLKDKACNYLKYPNVTEETDLSYGEQNHQKFDLLYDKSKLGKFVDGKYPVLLNIHGGGWITGNKKYRRGQCIQFADAGIFVVNMNYGLSPEFTFVQQMNEIYQMLEWIIQQKDKYSLDLDNFMLSGDSAGGHLSVLTAITTVNSEVREGLGLKDLGLKVRKIIPFSGIFDLTKPIFHVPLVNVMANGVMGTKGRKKYLLHPNKKYFCPLDYIDENFPEALVITGKQDFFTNTQNYSFVSKLLENGVKFRHLYNISLLNSFHCFHLKIFMPGAKYAMKEAVQFSFSHLLKDGEELPYIDSPKERLQKEAFKIKCEVTIKRIESMQPGSEKDKELKKYEEWKKKTESKFAALNDKHLKKRSEEMALSKMRSSKYEAKKTYRNIRFECKEAEKNLKANIKEQSKSNESVSELKNNLKAMKKSNAITLSTARKDKKEAFEMADFTYHKER